MEDFNTFTYIICLVFGMLQIILFFKIWGMTNDVRKLTEDVRKLVNHFCSSEQTVIPKPSKKADEKLTSMIYDKRLDSLKPGDKVKRKSDGKILIVEEIGKDTIFCQDGMFYGGKYYSKDSLEYVEQ